MPAKSKPKRIRVNDRMQRGYEYLLTKPTGKEFAAGFRPELTPKQLLRLGVFGGRYMTDCAAGISRRTGLRRQNFALNATIPRSIFLA